MNRSARLVGDWLVIVGTVFLADWLGPWSWWPALVVIGSRQQAIGEIGHMAMHTRRKLLSRIAFIGIGVDYDKYKSFHLAHHRHLGNREKDPEVAVQEQFRDRWLAPRRLDFVGDLMGLHIDEALVTLGRITTPVSLTPMALTLAALAAAWPIVLLYPAAAVTGLLFVHRLRSWTEHRHLTEPGRTIRKIKPDFWRRALYLPHGTWRHWEHHGGREA